MGCNCNSHCSCHEEHHEPNHIHTGKILVFRLIVSAILLIVGIKTNHLSVYILAYFISGYDVIINMIKNHKIFSESFLMTLATVSAFIIGEYPEAVFVMLFYQAGEFLSELCVNKSKKSILDLMDLRSDTAKVYRNSQFITENSQNVAVGETVIIYPGEKVPLDGTITKGSGHFDTSALSGESAPKKIEINGEILSGYINLNSVIEMKVTKAFDESTASKIIKMVNTNKRSNAEKFISKFAEIYTPFVVLIAFMLAFIPPIFTGNIKEWVYISLTFLVVSCPCALLVSVPLAFFAGIGGASKNDILIKGASVIEYLSKVKKIIFDKTGTLTNGKIAVTEINELIPDALFYAAHAEYYSSHPIAKAIVSKYGKEIDETIISDYEEIAGGGIRCIVNHHEIIIGSREFSGYTEQADKNCVYMTIDSKNAGKIIISDSIKPDAKNMLNNLSALSIFSSMLTGDSSDNAKVIAEELNISYSAGLLPDDKVNLVKSMMEKETVAFVGDGINDAPVLSIASVGISMGSLGSDAAIEASDVVIMTDNLTKIPVAIKSARKTMNIVYQNIFFSIGTKLLIMILSLFGLSWLWLAVFADVGVMILAVFNSLRAYKI